MYGDVAHCAWSAASRSIAVTTGTRWRASSIWRASIARFSARSVSTCGDGFRPATRTSHLHVMVRVILVIEADELLSFFYQRDLVGLAQRLERQEFQHSVLLRRAKLVPASDEAIDE